MDSHPTLQVLLVPDSIHWVTGTIATEISNKVPGIEAYICSEPVLHELLSLCNGRFPLPLDIVHFLTPHIATALFPTFSETTACVATIHHFENVWSIEPAPYVDSIMTVCSQWHDFLIEKGIAEDRLVMVRNGVNIKLFHPADEEERKNLRRRYGIPDDVFVIGFSAKRSSDSCNRKGINILEKLIDESSTNFASAWWVIRGPGWQSLVQQKRQNGARITHLPFLLEKDDVAESYRLMDAYIVTARIEGGPVPLIEAMSSGLCCVTTEVGLAPELIQDGTNGFLAGFDDTAMFLKRLTALEKDREMRQRIGMAARQTIVDNLKWEQTLSSVPELYQTAISAFRRRTLSSPNFKDNSRFQTVTEWSKRCLKNWITDRELLVLIDLLQDEGESEITRQLANSVLLKKPLNQEALSLYGSHSSISSLLKLAKKTKIAMRRVISKAITVTKPSRIS
ncbi:glycosyltransferase family 4 protein [Dendronalium sp. ChiSLP03b]|uniref:glycosyltransferase family 4 protein n=1 Tax=Dendronalium sp. ChiSLP03b TaxID=3075381 RepID=UPI002AD35732|nr:glycosyltransferase family 4 protein [Dendronalium sp. ChiSLP03b]MDZ8206522.1 glycosyltransferase family 4 protein [Dendronalium sp. ChiSLP03b]